MDEAEHYPHESSALQSSVSLHPCESSVLGCIKMSSGPPCLDEYPRME